MKSRILRIAARGIALLLFLVLLLLASQYQSDKPVDQLKMIYAKPPSRFLQMDGMEVHYRDEGPRNDPLPLVLIHGTSSSLHTWEALSSKLSKEKRVIRFDLPGFGLTGPNIGHQYQIADYVAFVNGFFQKLGLDSCIIAGNSLGGNIAWRYACADPEKTRKLILLNASGYPQPPADALGFRLGKTPIIRNLLTVITPKLSYAKHWKMHTQTNLS